jgi:hypothetical protein
MEVNAMIDGHRIEAGIDTVAFTLPYCYLKNARTYTVNGKERTTVGGDGWHGELYSYSRGQIKRRWWRFTLHTPKDGSVSLFSSSTLTPAVKAVLIAAGAPVWITGQMDAIKFCRVDVAYDLLGYDGVVPLDDDDQRTAKIRQLTEYKFVDIEQPGEPTLYLCSGKKPENGKIPLHMAAFVQCRYDKRRQMKEVYGVDISPRSRIENRYQTRRMCVRHGLGSLPEIVSFLTGLEEETERRNNGLYSNADTPPSEKKPTPTPQQSPTTPETTPTPHQTPTPQQSPTTPTTTPTPMTTPTPPETTPPSGILSPLGKGTASFAIRAPPIGNAPFPVLAA